jgi:two-component system sensor histidine kinase TctE
VSSSIRARLLRPLAWSWLAGMVVAGAGAWWLARSTANAAFDRGLQDQASALAAKVTWSDRGPLLDLSRQARELVGWDSADRNIFAMLDAEGNTLAGDAAVPLPPQLGSPQSFEQPVLFDAEHRGAAVRGALFAVASPMLDRTVSVVVIEPQRKRSALVRDLQLGMVLPALALGAVTFALLGWGIRRGLQPLNDVAAEVARRDANDWRPLSLGNVPFEAVPLIERINMLLDDVQQSLALQRRFVADAAHQLRTPVAGVRVLAQELEQELRLQATPQQDAAWQPLLQQLLASTERMSRLIGQLLSLARSETALSVNAEQTSMDIVPLVRESAEPLALQALKEGRSLAFDTPTEPVLARAHPLWLGEVVNNLLDNARRYGGVHIVLRVRALAAGGAELVVEDDGPGVAPEHVDRLFEPFWRGERADLRNDGGTGLGLTIAREIVERLGGTIQASTRPDFAGLRLTVVLAA